jgi:RNA polymerase sigma-70 factor (ECF subfamily)
VRVATADDGELVQRARQGSRDAAAELFRRHWDSAWRLARTVTGRRDMADDIAQDAFERAFAALSRFDRTRPFAPWLHRIVVNRALDLLRSERRLVGLDAADRIEGEWRDLRAEDAALLQAVAGLNPQRRVVIMLRYGLGYPPPEIAALLDLPVGTVHSRLARALDDLRDRQVEMEAHVREA